jgi:hypothetical protein
MADQSAGKIMAVAGTEQDKLTEKDPWQFTLATVTDHSTKLAKQHADDYVVTDYGEERITSQFLLGNALEIPVNAQTPEHAKRLARIMRKLGWQGPTDFKIKRPNQRRI